MKQWCVNFITIYYFDSITFDKLVQIYPSCFVYYNKHEYSSKIKKIQTQPLHQKVLILLQTNTASSQHYDDTCILSEPENKTTMPKLEVSGSDQAINSTLY